MTMPPCFRAAGLLAFVLIAVPGMAAAQSSDVQVISYNIDSKGNVTEIDSAGNTYRYNISNAVSSGQVTVTETTASGQTVESNFTVASRGSTLVAVNGVLNAHAINCTFNYQTLQVVSGDCSLFATGNSVAAPATTSATQATVRSQALAVTTIVADRVRAISIDIARSFLPPTAGQPQGSRYRGLAAGSGDARWGVWGDASAAYLQNDTAVGYTGASVVALSGLDYVYERQFVAGFTLGYSGSGVAPKSVRGDKISHGAVLGPYASYIINSNATVDAQFQYAPVANSIDVRIATAPLKTNYSSDRLTGSINLNAFTDYAPYRLTGFTGYSYTWEGADNKIINTIPGFSTNTRYGVWKLGSEVAYVIDQFEMYLPLTFLLETTTPRDRTSRAALQLGGGLRYQAGDNLKLGVVVTDTEIKTHTRDVRLAFNMRWTF